MHSQFHGAAAFPIITAALMLTACNGDGGNRNRGEGDNSITLDVGMTHSEAIELVSLKSQSQPRYAVIGKPYQERVTQRVPCSQMEVEYDRSARPNNPELWTCKSSNGYSYTKTVTRFEIRCCKPDRVRVPDTAVWQAVRAEQIDGWQVSADFSLGGERYEANWTVDEETKAVKEVETEK